MRETAFLGSRECILGAHGGWREKKSDDFLFAEEYSLILSEDN